MNTEFVYKRSAGGKPKKLSQSDRKRIAQSSGATNSDVVVPPSELGKMSNVLTPAKENKTVSPANPWYAL
jgi:signal recognition particle GTPase